MKETKHYQGLTDAQVLESRAKYGANVLTPPEEDSIWDQIKEVCIHPIAITMFILIAATAVLAGVLVGSMGTTIFVMPAIVAIATLLILIVGFFGGFGDPLFKILITAFVLSIGYLFMSLNGTMQSGPLSLNLLVLLLLLFLQLVLHFGWRKAMRRHSKALISQMMMSL